MTPNATKASTGAGVTKRRYRKVRFHADGLLDVERKSGKYFKMAQQNQRDSPLLRLPAELRNMIFAYVLGGKVFDIAYERKRNWEYGTTVTKSKNALALLAVSRQIYAETALMPFSLNTFSTRFVSAINEWVKDLGPSQVQSISNIQINVNINVYNDNGLPKWYLLPNPTSNDFTLCERLLSSEACSRGYVKFVARTSYMSEMDRDFYEAAKQRTYDHLIELFQEDNEGLRFAVQLVNNFWID